MVVSVTIIISGFIVCLATSSEMFVGDLLDCCCQSLLGHEVVWLLSAICVTMVDCDWYSLILHCSRERSVF